MYPLRLDDATFEARMKRITRVLGPLRREGHVKPLGVGQLPPAVSFLHSVYVSVIFIVPSAILFFLCFIQKMKEMLAFLLRGSPLTARGGSAPPDVIRPVPPPTPRRRRGQTRRLRRLLPSLPRLDPGAGDSGRRMLLAPGRSSRPSVPARPLLPRTSRLC